MCHVSASVPSRRAWHRMGHHYELATTIELGEIKPIPLPVVLKTRGACQPPLGRAHHRTTQSLPLKTKVSAHSKYARSGPTKYLANER